MSAIGGLWRGMKAGWKNGKEIIENAKKSAEVTQEGNKAIKKVPSVYSQIGTMASEVRDGYVGKIDRRIAARNRLEQYKNSKAQAEAYMKKHGSMEGYTAPTQKKFKPKEMEISNWDRIKEIHKNKDGSFNWTAGGITAFGAYTGASAVGRIASGGGLYRDSDGNFDIIGIPIV